MLVNTDLTNRLHQVHVVHKVSFPQVDCELMEEHSCQSSQSESAVKLSAVTYLFKTLSTFFRPCSLFLRGHMLCLDYKLLWSVWTLFYIPHNSFVFWSLQALVSVCSSCVFCLLTCFFGGVSVTFWGHLVTFSSVYILWDAHMLLYLVFTFFKGNDLRFEAGWRWWLTFPLGLAFLNTLKVKRGSR